jgi:hypothetical protein
MRDFAAWGYSVPELGPQHNIKATGCVSVFGTSEDEQPTNRTII